MDSGFCVIPGKIFHTHIPRLEKSVLSSEEKKIETVAHMDPHSDLG
jgi:hypothetical protein